MSTAFATLEDVIACEAFPDVDLMLRRGRHIDRDDGEGYTFLIDAQEALESFYRRFGCELIRKSDGYFYLLPTNERLGRRHLSSSEMVVGQALTLMLLDPGAVEHAGVVTREAILAQIAGVMGADAFVRAMNPKRRRADPRLAEATARARVSEALRKLSSLGFIELTDDTRVRLRPALLRFAEPVRGVDAPEITLRRLLDEGEAVLLEANVDGEADEEEDDDDDPNLVAKSESG